MKRLGLTLIFIAATLVGGNVAFSQTTGGPGVVIAKLENGMVIVRIGDQEQTVKLLGAKVGDKVVCTATSGSIEWKCRLHQG